MSSTRELAQRILSLIAYQETDGSWWPDEDAFHMTVEDDAVRRIDQWLAENRPDVTQTLLSDEFVGKLADALWDQPFPYTPADLGLPQGDHARGQEENN